MTLDEIRFEIVSRHLDWSNKARCAQKRLALVEAELEAHDRAVAAMPTEMHVWPIKARAPRRDIAALVRGVLLIGTPQTVAHIAEKTGVAPSRVLPALRRLMQEDAASQSADGRWFGGAAP